MAIKKGGKRRNVTKASLDVTSLASELFMYVERILASWNSFSWQRNMYYMIKRAVGRKRRYVRTAKHAAEQ